VKITIEDGDKSCTFEVPEWADEKRLILLAGVELLAQKEPWNNYIELKVERCSRCGQCCMTLAPDHERASPYGSDEEGKCKALFLDRGDIYTCGRIGDFFGCLKDPLDEPECSIVKDKVEMK
jgi:hypothetical protein